MRVALTQVARWLGIDQVPVDAVISGVSTDTRTLAPGNLFVALSGPNFDGHDYLEQARERGAAGAIVTREAGVDLAQLQVPDTLAALQALAMHWRDEVDPVVLAITGSAGKTTVKQMLAAICMVSGPTLATEGNLNNDVGVPLTLLRLEPHDRFAVIEMGANHVGEIARLTRIARPDHALVTMAGRAHLGEFGSVDKIIQAKGEIYQGLSGTGKTGARAVINLDSPGADHWIRHCPVHWDGFALHGSPHSRQARWVGAWSAHGGSVTISEQGKEILRDMPLPLPGKHNLGNLLAAVALARQANIPVDQIEQGLRQFEPPQGRMSLHHLADAVTLIDDSYNANPESMRAALKFLSAQPGCRVAVLGDMAELGAYAEDLHAELGRVVADLGLDGLVAVGELAVGAVATARAGAVAAVACASIDCAVTAVREHINQARSAGRPVTLLIKGSRFMRMERMIEQLQGQPVGQSGQAESASVAGNHGEAT